MGTETLIIIFSTTIDRLAEGIIVICFGVVEIWAAVILVVVIVEVEVFLLHQVAGGEECKATAISATQS